MPHSASVNPAEIAQFSFHAADWWNPNGAMRPLHRMNPARLDYIRKMIGRHYPDRAERHDILKGLSVLDIGCGAGLLCEPMARLGGAVTGLDASAAAIERAKTHAARGDLKIKYLCDSIEDYAVAAFARYDIITALEIIEHVADIDSFIQNAAKLLKPGGLMILSTVNRTAKSFLLGIIAAEYILNWVPRRTHDWRKFLKPSELAESLVRAGMAVSDITGVVFDPFNNAFHLREEQAGMNYMMTAASP